MCDNKHRLLSAICSPRGSLVFVKHWQHLAASVMCQTIDSLEYRCAVKAATHVSSPKSQKHILPFFFQVVSGHADSCGCICQGFENSASSIYAATQVQWGQMKCCCAQRTDKSHFKIKQLQAFQATVSAVQIFLKNFLMSFFNATLYFQGSLAVGFFNNSVTGLYASFF